MIRTGPLDSTHQLFDIESRVSEMATLTAARPHSGSPTSFPRVTRPSVSAGTTVFLAYIFAGLTIQVGVLAQLGISGPEASSWFFITWMTTGLFLLGVVPVHQTAGVHKSFDRGFGLHSWLCQRLQPGSNTGSQPGGRRGSGGAFPCFASPTLSPASFRPGHRRVLNCPGHHPEAIWWL